MLQPGSLAPTRPPHRPAPCVDLTAAPLPQAHWSRLVDQVQRPHSSLAAAHALGPGLHLTAFLTCGAVAGCALLISYLTAPAAYQAPVLNVAMVVALPTLVELGRLARHWVDPLRWLRLSQLLDVSDSSFLEVKSMTDTDPVVRTYVHSVLAQGRTLKRVELEAMRRHCRTANRIKP